MKIYFIGIAMAMCFLTGTYCGWSAYRINLEIQNDYKVSQKREPEKKIYKEEVKEPKVKEPEYKKEEPEQRVHKEKEPEKKIYSRKQLEQLIYNEHFANGARYGVDVKKVFKLLGKPNSIRLVDRSASTQFNPIFGYSIWIYNNITKHPITGQAEIVEIEFDQRNDEEGIVIAVRYN